MHSTADNWSLEDPPTSSSLSLAISLSLLSSLQTPSHGLSHPSPTRIPSLPDWLSLLSNAEQIRRTLRNVRLQSTNVFITWQRRHWVLIYQIRVNSLFLYIAGVDP